MYLKVKREGYDRFVCPHATGMHPGGLPCLKRTTIKFESITRDVRTLSSPTIAAW